MRPFSATILLLTQGSPNLTEIHKARSLRLEKGKHKQEASNPLYDVQREDSALRRGVLSLLARKAVQQQQGDSSELKFPDLLRSQQQEIQMKMIKQRQQRRI